MKSNWQKAVLVLAVGGVSLTSLADPAMAAAKPAVGEVKLVVDGQEAALRTLQVKGVSLISVRDLARSFGIVPEYAAGSITLNTEVTVQLTVGSPAYTVDGETKQFAAAPFEAGGTVFAELNSLVEALGGSVEGQGANAVIRSFQLLDGSFSSARWISGNRVLAAREDDKSLYVIDALTKKSTLLTSDENAAGLAISPDGKSGIFTAPTGEIKVINLQTGIIRTVTTDTSVKTDLVWSADGGTVYFIQGDNQDKLASLKLDSGAITKLIEDKVNFKSDLRVSADDKKLLYIVNVTGVAKNDSNSTEESLTIDYSGAGTQLVQFSPDSKDAKPVVLAAGKTNKLYPQLLKDGSAAYISTDPEAENPLGSLQLVTAPDKAVQALPQLDAVEASATPAGELLVTGVNKDGQTELLIVQPDGSAKAVASSTAEVTDAYASADGQAVGLNEGKVVLVTSAGLIGLTR